MLVRPCVIAGAGSERGHVPGDIIPSSIGSLAAGAISTVGAGTWTAAAIANGLLRRTGPTGAYTDTTDTAANIIAAIKGNYDTSNTLCGVAFELVVQNTVAYALTFAAGTGVVAGTGTLDIAASKVRKYLVTILNDQPVVTLNGTVTNGSKVITFALPAGAASIPMLGSGAELGYVQLTPGMSVTGTGIASGAKVDGITLGQGGFTGVHLDTNSTADGTNIQLTFGPSIRFDSINLGDL